MSGFSKILKTLYRFTCVLGHSEKAFPFKLESVTTQDEIEIRDTMDLKAIIIFVSPECSACTQLMPSLNNFSKPNDFSLIVVTMPRKSTKLQEYKLLMKESQIPLIVSEDLFDKYHIPSLPYGIVVEKDLTIQSFGFVSNIDFLETLVMGEKITA